VLKYTTKGLKMNKDEYNHIRGKFLQDTYDTPEYPASIARVMLDKKIISIFTKEQNQSYQTNVKLYIRWLRKLRDKRMFKGNMHDSKPSKFVSIFGIYRGTNLYGILRMIK